MPEDSRSLGDKQWKNCRLHKCRRCIVLGIGRIVVFKIENGRCYW